MAKPQDLRGWNAVITGGAGGLGRATAARLIQRG
ncbi:NAD(P)-dependent oxidoreductase, partial [Xanthomonas perforans]